MYDFWSHFAGSAYTGGSAIWCGYGLIPTSIQLSNLYRLINQLLGLHEGAYLQENACTLQTQLRGR
jgi:hypothetical protein